MVKGQKHTKETRQKMSQSQKGRKHSEETKKKISESRKGIKFSQEHKEKIGNALRGRVVSEETRRRLSESLKGGEKSVEVRQKISNSMKGKNKTYEFRAMMKKMYENKRCSTMTEEEFEAHMKYRGERSREGIQEYWRKVKAGEIKRKPKGPHKNVSMKEEERREKLRSKDIGDGIYHSTKTGEE